MAKKWDFEFVDSLLQSSDYRSFLKKFFENGSRSYPKLLSYAEASRRSGFKSRSFIRDIVNGSKRIGSSNIEQIMDGLSFPDSIKIYFRALVLIEEHQTLTPSKSRSPASLAVLRERVLRQYKAKANSEPAVLKNPYFALIPTVFAACGLPGKGASLEEVSFRSKLTHSKLILVLAEMMNLKLIEKVNERYLPCEGHVAIAHLGEDSFFKADFLRSTQLAAQRINTQADCESSLFLSSTFSVRASSLNKFRVKLNELLIDFINECENAEGDSVAELTLAFTSNNPQN